MNIEEIIKEREKLNKSTIEPLILNLGFGATLGGFFRIFPNEITKFNGDISGVKLFSSNNLVFLDLSLLLSGVKYKNLSELECLPKLKVLKLHAGGLSSINDLHFVLNLKKIRIVKFYNHEQKLIYEMNDEAFCFKKEIKYSLNLKKIFS